ncbi:uncharacterized protein [Glycine max]|uniref:uncharacterized protein isoform X2 n=1 Tax=Glycine max TaxID=3847 RepID=UPI001B356A65|nr:uncharacterized protein LOC100812515 isoform X2 [Glycine max]
MFQKPHASTPKAWTSASMSAAFVGPNSNPVLSSLPSCILPKMFGVQYWSMEWSAADSLSNFNFTVSSKPHRKGAELDGPIKYEVHGKVAAMRCIDGHVLGLYEPV